MKADIANRGRHVRFLTDTVEKGFSGVGWIFSEALMRRSDIDVEAGMTRASRSSVSADLPGPLIFPIPFALVPSTGPVSLAVAS